MLKGCLTSIWLGIVLITLVVLNQFVFDLPDEPQPIGQFIDVGDGVRMHYEERPGKGPALVFIHGLPGTLHDFDPIIKRLEGRHIIAIDRPGFGDSTGGTQTMDGQVESVHKLITERGVKDATIVGHSYGGALALALAEQHPEDAGRIVTLAAAAGGHRTDAIDKFNATLINATHLPAIEQVNELLLSNMLLRGVGEIQVKQAFSPDPVVDAYKRRMLTYTMKDSDLLALVANVRGFDQAVRKIDARLADIEQPAVIMQGRDDKLVKPTSARAIAGRMPGAKTSIVAGGHMLMYRYPKQIVRQIHGLEASTASNR